MQRHPVDGVSLVFGLLFAAAGAVLVTGRPDVLTQAKWLLPALLIAVAVAMFAVSAWMLSRPGGSDHEDR